VDRIVETIGACISLDDEVSDVPAWPCLEAMALASVGNNIRGTC
jgi:hypothetical protein